MYFGVEFCQHLLPSADDVAAAAAVAERRGLGLSLLTPYATDEAVERIEPLLDCMEEAPDPEVIVNDWGVLSRVRARARLRPVLGRGLNRMTRDPRLPDVGPEHLGGDAPPATWRMASHDAGPFRRLLDRLDVQRIETDMPLQGLQPPPPDGQRLSVHLPWGMVASGRICMVNAWGKPASQRFVPPRHCDAPCRRFTVQLRAPWSRREAGAEGLPMVDEGQILPLDSLLNRRRNELPVPEADPAPRFWTKGNTHFFLLEGPALGRALAWADASPAVDRVVVAPDLPM